MGIRHLIEKYDPRQVCAVLDQAHYGLNGEPPEFAIDIVWPYLNVVNLKSAYWRRMNGPDGEWAEWKVHWTAGIDWPIGREWRGDLERRGFSGDICLTTEYSDDASVDRLIAEDIAFAEALFDAR